MSLTILGARLLSTLGHWRGLALVVRALYDCLCFWTGPEAAEHFSVARRPYYKEYQVRRARRERRAAAAARVHKGADAHGRDELGWPPAGESGEEPRDDAERQDLDLEAGVVHDGRVRRCRGNTLLEGDPGDGRQDDERCDSKLAHMGSVGFSIIDGRRAYTLFQRLYIIYLIRTYQHIGPVMPCP